MSEENNMHCDLPWQIGITLYPYSHIYGPADKDGFCKAVGSCVTALGKEYDEANAVLIVRSVNAIPALVKALEDIWSRLAGPADAKSYDISQIVDAALAAYRKDS